MTLGRPRRQDDEALRRMWELVEGQGWRLRPAARQVGKERGYPKSAIGALEEWARKEYVRRKAAGTLPVGSSLPIGLAEGIKNLDRKREAMVADARRTLQDCAAKAPAAGVDLATAGTAELEAMRAEAMRLADLLTSSPESIDPDLRPKLLTTDAILEHLREAQARYQRLGTQIELLSEYFWARRVLEEYG